MIAVGGLPLHDSRTQEPLGAVVGRLDLSGLGDEDQELIASAADLGLQLAGQVTAARCGQDGAVLPIQAPALGRERRGSQVGHAPGQGEHASQPELQAPGDGIVAELDDIGDVAG